MWKALVQPGTCFKATATSYRVELNAEVDCNSNNFCYAISCTKARSGQQYIGQTGRSLREPISQHLNYVDRNCEATGRHFNLPGHTKSYMRVTIVEKIHKRDVWTREEVETMHIRNSNSFFKGINLKPN